MKKKAAIASVHWKNNYGSLLQSYALQQALNKMNIDNEIIDMTLLNRDIRKKRTVFYLTQIFRPSFVKAKYGKIKYELLKKTLYAKRLKDIGKRAERFDEFKKKFILSKRYKNMNELTEECGKYTDIIAGSDQLWLPINIAGDYYTLSFAPDGVNKVSYGTSFGVADLPKSYYARGKRFLNRIDHLSVREESGRDLIMKLTGRGAEVVCDPTLLFDAAGWEELIPNEKIIDGAYIFCYFLGGDVNHRNFVKKLKEQTNLPIVAMIHMEEYYKCDNNFADIAPFDVGPAEFVNLLRHAEYVCTDSYHGTIFSLLHGKKFFAFKRYGDRSKMSTNTRIYSLLNAAGIEGRYLSGTESLSQTAGNQIDYDAVNIRLKGIREASFKFLKGALRTVKQ